MQNIFDQIGFTDIFDRKVKCDIIQCEDRLKANMHQEWEAKIKSKAKLRTYIKYK